MRKALIVLIIIFGVFLAIGCTDNNQPANQTGTPVVTPVNTPVAPAGTPQPIDEGKIVDVTIQNYTFNPPSVEVSAGDTVRWTNKDSVEHSVSGQTFGARSLQKEQSYQYLFTIPGVYNYDCSIHPDMKGTVIVVEKS